MNATLPRGGGLRSAVVARANGGLETASPLTSVPQRGGGLQSAVGARANGGLETASPLAADPVVSSHFSPSRYFDPKVEIGIHGSWLPHWEQPSTLCFITFRLADSLPQEKLSGFLERRKIWLSLHPRPWDETTGAEYEAEFGGKLETWLDAGHGSCILRDSRIRGIVEDALRHFDGERYALDSFVVMPNHVHVLFAPMRGHDIAGIVKSWKSFSARQINVLSGGSGTLWQKNYWDTLIRNAKHHRRTRKYIFDNDPAIARMLHKEDGVFLTAVPQRGGGLQSAVGATANGGLETASPLATVFSAEALSCT